MNIEMQKNLEKRNGIKFGNSMKKQIAFIIADDRNLPYAKMCINSLRKFHSADELPVKLITGKELEMRLIMDKDFFYRAIPIIASELLQEYELVLKLDADQIITGPLTDILEDKSYDLGSVLNFNPTDYKNLGPITTYIIHCMTYMNCGFVAMRNKKMVDHWKKLCLTPAIFNNLQYREQDIMNILFYFGDYKTKCFDHKDPQKTTTSWYGLASYGEWLRVELQGDKLILPKNENGYPDKDIEIRCIHFAHGNVEKMNYKIYFEESVIKRLDYLVGEKNDK